MTSNPPDRRPRRRGKNNIEMILFALGAHGTHQQIADAYNVQYNSDITNNDVRFIRLRYGPGHPLPKDDSGRYTRAQVQFVLDAWTRVENDETTGVTKKFETIADQYNSQFYPTVRLSHRAVRQLKENYGPAQPLPLSYTDEQVQFVQVTTGTPADVAAAYNERFAPEVKMGTCTVAYLKTLPAHGHHTQVLRPPIPPSFAPRPLAPHPVSSLPASDTLGGAIHHNASQDCPQQQQFGSVNSVYGEAGPWDVPGHDGYPFDPLHSYAAQGGVQFLPMNAATGIPERVQTSAQPSTSMVQTGVGAFESTNNLQHDDFQQHHGDQQNGFLPGSSLQHSHHQKSGYQSTGLGQAGTNVAIDPRLTLDFIIDNTQPDKCEVPGHHWSSWFL